MSAFAEVRCSEEDEAVGWEQVSDCRGVGRGHSWVTVASHAGLLGGGAVLYPNTGGGYTNTYLY